VDPLLRPLQLVVAVGFRGRGKAAPVEAPSWTLTVVVETTMHEMLSSSKLLFPLVFARTNGTPAPFPALCAGSERKAALNLHLP
jgi:hypothetical protein